MRCLIPLLLAAGPLWADCAPNPDHAAAKAGLLAQLKVAPDPATAQIINGELWQLWLDAPDEIAQAMLNDGMARRQSFDFLGSRTALTALIEYCPDYAEGWNQRAFASFLARDFPAALADLDRALTLDPAHIGALSGKGLTLIEMGRLAEGQEAIRAAVALHPWLAERALLDEPPGTDL